MTEEIRVVGCLKRSGAMYGYICPRCGAHLDPGEPCDCEQEKEIRELEQKDRERAYMDMLCEDRSSAV